MENSSVLDFAELSSSSQPAEATPDTAKYLFRMLVYTIVFILGIPGNCLILRVYWTKSHKTSTHVLIMALAWADFMVCLTQIFNITEESLLFALGPYGAASIIFDFSGAFRTTAIGTSIMITAVIAADRYDCVCRPHRRFFTHRRGKIAAWASLIFSACLNIPQYIQILPDVNIQSLPMIRLASHVLLFVTALVMVAICYTLVYGAIKKHVRVGAVSTVRGGRGLSLENEWSTRVPTAIPQTVEAASSVSRAHKPSSSSGNQVTTKISEACTQGIHGAMSGQESQTALTQQGNVSTESRQPVDDDRKLQLEPPRARGNPQKATVVALQRKTTKMLFVTSIVFLLAWLPYWILIAITFAMQGGLYVNPVASQILTQLMLVYYVNHVVNPIIYGIANKRFRKDCRDVLRKINVVC